MDEIAARLQRAAEDMRTMRKKDQERKTDGIATHFVAAIAGFALMLLGVGISVTMVLLPVGIPVGLLGLGILIWGLTPGWRS